MFRAKYPDGLGELLAAEQLGIPPQLAYLADAGGRPRWLRRWRRKRWVVYSRPPFAGPRKLIDYLGRYTHCVAISNHRLLDIDITRCPRCCGPLHSVTLPRPDASRPRRYQTPDGGDFPPWDTS
jgi:hypothetical protein